MGVPCLIPVDKFNLRNLSCFKELYEAVTRLPDHTKYNFLDEKHLLNRDVYKAKVRQDPLTGYLPYIKVSGDFRDAFNLFACISTNTEKNLPVFYNIQKNRGTSVSFMEFIVEMIACRFLRHNEVIVMDNAAIHSGGESTILEDILWNTVIDEKLLRIFLLPLLTSISF